MSLTNSCRTENTRLSKHSANRLHVSILVCQWKPWGTLFKFFFIAHDEIISLPVFRSWVHNPDRDGGRNNMHQLLCSLLEKRLARCRYQDELRRPTWVLLSMPGWLQQHPLCPNGPLHVEWNLFRFLFILELKSKYTTTSCREPNCKNFGPCYCGINYLPDGRKACKVPFPGQECTSWSLLFGRRSRTYETQYSACCTEAEGDGF